MIKIQNLKKTYKDCVALDTISMHIRKGEFVAIIGASGSGKTTLLNIIGGLDTDYMGSCVVRNKEMSSLSDVECCTLRSRYISYVYQFFNLISFLTVKENMCLTSQIKGKKVDEKELNQVLKLLGLENKKDRFANELSGGQQQRVALARMLAAKPDILMLDEPFSALDAHLKGVLEQNLAGLFETFHGTILYVSHDIDEALRFCDRIAVIEKGHVMEVSTGSNLVNNPQSAASIRLSGCKNTTLAHRVDAHRIFLPAWGIEVETDKPAPENLTYMGVRAFFLERAEEPGRNTYRVRVVRTSDSRFDRSVLLEFLDRTPGSDPVVEQTENEMKYLEQHLFWRVDKLKVPEEKLPVKDEVLLIRIPSDKVYLVSK